MYVYRGGGESRDRSDRRDTSHDDILDTQLTRVKAKPRCRVEAACGRLQNACHRCEDEYHPLILQKKTHKLQSLHAYLLIGHRTFIACLTSSSHAARLAVTASGVSERTAAVTVSEDVAPSLTGAAQMISEIASV